MWYLLVRTCGVGEDSWESLELQRSNQSILKEINPEYSLERLMLKQKLQYFGHLMQRADSFEKSIFPDAGKDWRRAEKGTTEDEMVGWHQRLNGHEFEDLCPTSTNHGTKGDSAHKYPPGAGDAQGGLVCCSGWGRRESDTTERLNCTVVLLHVA